MDKKTNEQNTRHEKWQELIKDQEASGATAALCRKKHSPLQNGSVLKWSRGIIHAIGFVNFLFDKTTSPYVSANELSSAFEISQSTAGNKSK